MATLLIKRFFAFAIDYGIIVLYGLLLFGVTLLVHDFQVESLEPLSPIRGQILGFFSLTLPVFLYFYLSEKGQYKGTLGKRLMRIAVVKQSSDKQASLLIRNLLKFLPWEIAHVGVHWAYFYAQQNVDPPIWVWIVLIIPQVIVLGYGISIILLKGESSLYDRAARTRLT